MPGREGFKNEFNWKFQDSEVWKTVGKNKIALASPLVDNIFFINYLFVSICSDINISRLTSEFLFLLNGTFLFLYPIFKFPFSYPFPYLENENEYKNSDSVFYCQKPYFSRIC